MSTAIDIALTVNGERVSRRVEARRHLVDFLRLDLGLMGSHTGCEHGICGACTVRVDGESCAAAWCWLHRSTARTVETIEGVSDTRRNPRPAGGVHRPQRLPVRLLHARHAAHRRRPAARANPQPTRAEIREHLSGNYCRCTGYHAIVDAVGSRLPPSATEKAGP